MRLFVATLSLCLALCLVGSAPVTVSAQPSPYNASLSMQLLHLSGAAYCGVQSVEDWTCSFCSEVPGFQPYGVEYNSTTDMLAFVGYLPSTNSVIISFRGTSLTSILDWVEDLNFFAVSAICPGCQVHEGFLAAYYSIRDATVEYVHAATKAHPGAEVVITGHSLGGALAFLAAVDLSINEGINMTTSYTFGQPRVGNSVFADVWRQMFYESTTSFRVTHGLDPGQFWEGARHTSGSCDVREVEVWQWGLRCAGVAVSGRPM